MARRLTLKQRRFVEAYLGEAAGNASKAARLAGYKGNAVTIGAVGAENLKKPQVLSAIARRQRKLQKSSKTLTPEKIHELWMDIAENGDRVSDRLKATELAAKTLGMFERKRDDDRTGALRVVAVWPDDGR